MARKALSDGKLTEGEYHAIMSRFDADRAADAAQAKADALRKWGRTASAGDARSDETGNTDSARKGEHATAKPGRPTDTTQQPGWR